MSVRFSELGIEKDLVEALDSLGITEPFEIQAVSYTHLTLPTICSV